MSKKQTLVNNGLPKGLSFKDINPGDIILVKWRDATPSHHVVADSDDGHRPKTYKGPVSFGVVGEGATVEGDQIICKAGSVNDLLQSMNNDLSDKDLALRAE
ncbi:hypothetical protein D3C87_1391620 [compost metagenome]